MEKKNYTRHEIAVLNAIDNIKEPKKITPAILNALDNLVTSGIVERLPWSSRHSRYQNKTEQHIFELVELLGEGMHFNSPDIPSLSIHVCMMPQNDSAITVYRVYVNDVFRFETINGFGKYHIISAEHDMFTLAELWDQLIEVYEFGQSTLV